MPMAHLKDVYIDQLQDLYSACKQSLPVTEELGRAAKSPELSRAFIDGARGISEGMDKLASLCAEHGVSKDGAFCKGMEGLVKEARAHALEEEFSDDDARDAMIITQYQRMAHYAIAGYGCLRTFANRLGLDADAAVLAQCLDDSYDGDRRMTDIATGEVNKKAA